MTTSGFTLPNTLKLSISPPAKLNSTNFVLWKSQIVPLLKSFDLYKYVDGYTPAPPEFVRDPTTQTPIDNPDYLQWNHQDKLLLSWLISCLSDDSFLSSWKYIIFNCLAN
ncbi:hypothetical protein MKW92_018816, partial [Papaver armeniacum]